MPFQLGVCIRTAPRVPFTKTDVGVGAWEMDLSERHFKRGFKKALCVGIRSSLPISPWLTPNPFPHVSRIAAQIRCICTGHMGWPIQRQGALETERSFGFAVSFPGWIECLLLSWINDQFIYLSYIFNSAWFDWLWTWFSQFTLLVRLEFPSLHDWSQLDICLTDYAFDYLDSFRLID